jgi:ketosteroid isomerase-like protein
MPIPDDFQQMLQQERVANEQFLAGDAGPAKLQWSHADDVTICGGFGAYEKGWEQVGPRLDWAAAAYRGGHSTIEMLAMGTSDDLAYAVWIDRGQVRMAGREEFSPSVLRITQIYRREEGIWKVIHRHGDPITDKTEVSAILQQ